MILNYFRDLSFHQAVKALFKGLNVPVNYIADEPTTAKDILKDTYKDNSTFQLVNEVYFVGMVDDAAFEGNKSLAVDKIKSDYDGILIFGVTLNRREKNQLPTRSQLAEISRAFNREFYYTPVVLVFRYADDQRQYISFASTERLKYKQEWREGEKAGKVSLLRDIDIQHPHRGHEDIIKGLRIQTSGIKAIDSFAKLYAYWQEVFSVNILNKRFYQELSNWYFFAVKEVEFPGKPTAADAVRKNAKLDDLIQEHNATNIIRLLTRLLFTWFIKEKKLIPEELFDLEALQKDILIEISPIHEHGLFKEVNNDSVYYKAILQNLFFASLNCPIQSDGTDTRKRGFRGDGYGTHRGIDYLMRYKRYFKNPDAFLELMNGTVPFLNGGLFECLDDKYSNKYIDGFSDQMIKGEQLKVPDYLFFGTPEEVDLSTDYGVFNDKTKKALVKGLINILKSYKFTITENTPIEEDVALDPELLGKVFENLLASYNPETKTTARKRTGSFYTPREIVNYMVDESLIAYLKNAVNYWGMEDNQVDEHLHKLVSFDAKNPFVDNPRLTRDIVLALDRCKILDPACGSGAFPMGALQKMVHMLQKLDPDNLIWKEIQIQKVQEETSEVFKTIEDKEEREEKLKEINNAFDKRINDPDYARKLYLIENCIYGVDIQLIAAQISKLRFFISLVVDQKNNANPDENFGIRTLPNLETRFVTANSLVGIDEPNAQLSLYETKEVKELETELKRIRHKLFSARTKETKLKYRRRDKELRNAIAVELEKNGWKSDNAQKIANWDPYDQNASSTFSDPEWMFGIKEGFDVVIGNPPYISFQAIDKEAKKKYTRYVSASGKYDMYVLFIENALEKLSSNGVLCFINSNKFLNSEYGIGIKKVLLNYSIDLIVDFNDLQIFESATNYTCILKVINRKANKLKYINSKNQNPPDFGSSPLTIQYDKLGTGTWSLGNNIQQYIIEQIYSISTPLDEYSTDITQGLRTGHLQSFFNLVNKKLVEELELETELISTIFTGKNVKKFKSSIDPDNDLFIFPYDRKTFEPVDLKKYKNTYNYLLKFKNELDERKDSGKIFKNTDKKWYEYWDKKIITFNYPKIVFPDISSSPNFYLDEKGIPLLNSCYAIYLKKKKYYRPIYAILNSKLTDYYVKTVSPFVRGGYYRYKSSYVSSIPIVKQLDLYIDVLTLLTYFAEHSILQFESILNGVVLNMYFPEHMQERDISILPLVENDIKKVMQGREYEKLSNTEKEQVIEKLQQIWSHPDSEVRNRIKLFAVRSPEILKPILEN